MLHIHQLQFNMGKINAGRKLEFSALQVANMKLKTEYLGSTLQDL